MANFIDYEKSAEDGMPVELYDISYSGKDWHFTTNIENVTYEGNVYHAVAIQRGETEDTGDATKSDMEIKIARTSEIGELFKVTPPSEPITITIRQYHAFLGYQLPNQQTITVWKGRVTNVSWQGEELVLTAESVFSSLLRVGVTRKFSRQCTHTLYGAGCRVNRQNYKLETKARNIVGTVLSLETGQTDNWFAGGYIQYNNDDSNAVEFRQIIASTANTITLNAIPLGLVANKTDIKLFAGCDHTHETCINKFNNIENYGGQPFIPIQNPFKGGNIF